MVVEMGGGIRGVDAGTWLAGVTRAGGCDVDGVMPVGASSPFGLSEIGRFFSRDTVGSTVVGVGGGCDEDGVISVGASATSAFLLFLLSLLFWVVPFAASF